MNHLHKEQVTWSLFKLALPILFILGFDNVSGIISTRIIGTFYGAEALGSYSFALNLMNIINPLLIGFLWSTAIMVGQYFAGNNLYKVKQTINMSIILVSGVSIFLLLLWLIFPLDTLANFSDAETIARSKTYLNLFFFGLIFKTGILLAFYILYGLGDALRPLVFMFISFVLKNLLGVVFIFFLFKNSEAFEWAELISNIIMLIAIGLYLYRSNDLINESINEFRISMSAFLIHLRIAVPLVIQGFALSASTLILTSFLMKITSPDYYSGVSIAKMLIAFPSLLIHCLIIALTIFVSQNSAAGRNDRVINALAQTLAGCAIIVVLTASYFIVFGKITISFFGYEGQILEPAKKHLLFYSLTLILVAVNQALNAVFRGSGDTVIPLAIILFSIFFIKLPASIFELKFFENGQMYIGETLGALSVFIFSLVYFATGFYKYWALAVPQKN